MYGWIRLQGHALYQTIQAAQSTWEMVGVGVGVGAT